jgi:hypothetical protein
MIHKTPTPKQRGDAAEMLVAANLTLNGIPSLLAPENWPGYDVIAEHGKRLQKISVKCRGPSGIDFRPKDFDWLAIVLIDESPREFFIIPASVAAEKSKPKNSKRKDNGLRTLSVRFVRKNFQKYLNNFKLKT